jgi:MFS family permease
MQAGFAIASNNEVGQILEVKFAWTNPTFMNTMITSSAIFGMMIGSLFSGSIVQYGRRRSMMVMNLLIIVSCSASLVFNVYAITIAKFF